jgi:hypothetical protein
MPKISIIPGVCFFISFFLGLSLVVSAVLYLVDSPEIEQWVACLKAYHQFLPKHPERVAACPKGEEQEPYFRQYSAKFYFGLVCSLTFAGLIVGIISTQLAKRHLPCRKKLADCFSIAWFANVEDNENGVNVKT